jgi:branched-chain amino acid transport system substrate-binding protein
LDRRQALRLLAGIGAAGAAAPLLAACGGAGAEEDEVTVAHDTSPIKIGMVVPQSGSNKSLGDEMIHGFELYLSLNEKIIDGRPVRLLGGRPVELVQADEGETAESGRAATERLITEDKVAALTGVVNASVLTAVKDLVETSQIPLVGSNASPVSLQGAKYIWRTSFAGDEPGRALGQWVAEHANGGSVFVLAGDSPGARDDVKGFVDALTAAGGKIEGAPVYTPVSPTPTKDFSQQFAALRNSKAAALFCLYSGSSAVDFVKQMRSVDASLPPALKVYAPGSLTEGPTLKLQGDAAKNIFTAMNYSADLDYPANLRFVSQYQTAYNASPSTYAMAAYDAAAVLDRAIESAAREDSNLTINAAIGRLGQIDSPRGPWQFNQNRTPQQKWYLRQVKTDGGLLSNVLIGELTTLG